MKNKITTDKDNIAKFKKTGELYGKKIECNSCNTLITCFGSNLLGKIAKHGGIETLLETFTCRSCVSASKPKKEKKISVRFMKRKEKEAKKELPIPQVKPYVSREVYLKDSPELVSEMTNNGVCIRPDIYLNDGCKDCFYFNNCNATVKEVKYATT